MNHNDLLVEGWRNFTVNFYMIRVHPIFEFSLLAANAITNVKDELKTEYSFRVFIWKEFVNKPASM